MTTTELALKAPEYKQSLDVLAELRDSAAFIEVKDKDSDERCLEVRASLKGLIKKAKASLEFLTGGLKEEIKKIESPFKALIREAEGIDDGLNVQSTNYQRKLLAERREQERLAAVAQQEADRKAEAEKKKAEKKGEVYTPPPAPVLPPVPAKAEPTRTFTGATGSAVVKKFGRVVNFAKVPDEYKLIKQGEIDRDIRAGKIIPGVEIYEDIETRIRA